MSLGYHRLSQNFYVVGSAKGALLLRLGLDFTERNASIMTTVTRSGKEKRGKKRRYKS